MQKTKHAVIRSQQRGIQQKMIDVILTYGTTIRRPGGAWEYRITKQKKNEIIASLKHEIRAIEKSIGRVVLTTDDQKSILTVYHLR